MITLSGWDVQPDGFNAPPLYDIGWGLAGINRFAGQTMRPWTVLQHVWACQLFADLKQWPVFARLHCALHDASEAIVGDIVHQWKTPDMSARMHQLDERIWASLSIKPPTPMVKTLVKQADYAILLAEAREVGTTKQQESIAGWTGQAHTDPAAVAAVVTTRVVLHRTEDRDYLADRYVKLINALKEML